MLKLEIIIDNNTLKDELVTEAGFSALIETDDKRVLLDTGRHGNIIGNAKKLGINLLNLDYIVLSHGHHDHSNGLAELIELYNNNNIAMGERPIIIAHPDAFLKRYKEGKYLGYKVPLEELEKNFIVRLVKKPFEITPNLIYLGEISRINNFEAKKPLGNIIRDDEEPDFILDDTGLVYKSDDGLVIIVGCSHAGICNIIDYAKKICDDERIIDIIGGLHLKNSDEEYINKTINGIVERSVKNIHACHCTGEDAFKDLKNTNLLKQINIGCGYKTDFK